MSVWRIYRVNLSLHPAASLAWRLIILILVCWWGTISISAQGQLPQASITSVKGDATLQRNVAGNPHSYALKVGVSLQISDVIDTGAGSVVIAMQDGSQITIHPRSRVILRNFSSGTPWRDLLEVVAGQIRARINHQWKRPNPYRVYSPIASIAVRGTDFLVSVEPSTETRVLVFEGLVEVNSLVNPQKTALVRPGQNVVIRPGGDISLVMGAPRGELNEIRSSLIPNRAYYNHDTNYTDFRPPRFTAFGDSHLDSLQNPAYATEFREHDGRFYLIPSFSPHADITYKFDDGRLLKGAGLLNYTISPQLSYFAPLGPRIVVGGGAAVTKTDLRGNGIDRDPLSEDGTASYDHYDQTAKFTTTNLSLMAARRFGQAERTSLGIEFDYLADQSLLVYDHHFYWSIKGFTSLHRNETRKHNNSLSVGLTHNIGDDKKLGIYYRYGIGSVMSRFRETVYDQDTYPNPQVKGVQIGPDRISEAGARFRGSLTQRLFYGLEGSMISERIRQVYDNDGLPRDIQNRRITLSAGAGYALRPHTVFSLDLSAGFVEKNFQIKHAEGGVYDKDQDYFYALHGGVQTDLGRNFFAGASIAMVRDHYKYFNRHGSVYYYETYSFSSTDVGNFSNFTIGWRMAPRWIVQYVYFPSYAYNSTSHSVIIRHEFGGKKGTGEMSGIKP